MEEHEAELIRAAEELTGLQNPYPKGFVPGSFLTAADCRSLADDALVYHTLLCVAEGLRRAVNQNRDRAEFPASFVALYAHSRDREVQDLARELLSHSGAALSRTRMCVVVAAMYRWAHRDTVTG